MFIVKDLFAPNPLSTVPLRVIVEFELFVLYSFPFPYIVIGIPNTIYVVPLAVLLAIRFFIESNADIVIES